MDELAAMREKNERNARVQTRYDVLMSEGRRGHYETLFKIVREEVEAERERCAKVLEGAAGVLICGRRRTNQVDRHTADVLMNNAEKIRAVGQEE